MFVNNEITERGLLHRLLDRVSNEVTMEPADVLFTEISEPAGVR